MIDFSLKFHAFYTITTGVSWSRLDVGKTVLNPILYGEINLENFQ